MLRVERKDKSAILEWTLNLRVISFEVVLESESRVGEFYSITWLHKLKSRVYLCSCGVLGCLISFVWLRDVG